MIMTYINIVGTSPALLKGWQDLPKIESFGGGTKLFVEWGDKPEK